MYRLVYVQDAQNDLRRLNPQVAHRIIKKISHYAQQIDFRPFCKQLAGSEHPRYRFRIGSYRALFCVDLDTAIPTLVILRIKHRKDIYSL